MSVHAEVSAIIVNGLTLRKVSLSCYSVVVGGVGLEHLILFVCDALF